MKLNYKLNLNKKGYVNYLTVAGKDVVKAQMSEAMAKAIIDNGEVIESTYKDYPIHIGDKYWFDGEIIISQKKAKKKEVAEAESEKAANE